MPTLIALAVLVLSYAIPTPASAQTPACRDLQECRQLALDAAARQDYSAFHDLAWKALGLGPKNDPALMTMLARAQSLSGRPHDALVMLQRLAAMGVITDAATSDDFSRVRALPAWADFEASTSGKPATPGTEKPVTANTEKPAAATKAPPAPEKAPPKPAAKTTPPPTVTKPPADPDPPATTAAEKPPTPDPAPSTTADVKKPDLAKSESKLSESVAPTAEAKGKPSTKTAAPLVFAAPGLTATGLSYDAVSGRFIIGDSKDRRLLVVGERSGRLASLAGVDAGFDAVSAFEIDTVEGDLWVVSASSESRTSRLHKLQLISGRVLASIQSAAEEGPSRFTDVAVTPQSILVLDAEGRRIYRVAKKGRVLEMVARLAAPECTSLAVAGDGNAYAAYDRGLVRIDLTTRATTVVEPSAKVDLNGLKWIRWHRGSLVAIQGDESGKFRLVRVRLDETGRRARALEVLDEQVAIAGASSATLSGGAVYYLSSAADNQVEVKKLTLK
jgi:hypothetical protein